MMLSALKDEAQEAVDRMKRSLAYALCIGVCCVTAYVAAVIAAGAALTPVLGLAWAALSIAGGSLLIAGGVMAVRAALVRYRRRIEAEQRRALERAAAQAKAQDAMLADCIEMVFQTLGPSLLSPSLLSTVLRSKRLWGMVLVGGLAYAVTRFVQSSGANPASAAPTASQDEKPDDTTVGESDDPSTAEQPAGATGTTTPKQTGSGQTHSGQNQSKEMTVEDVKTASQPAERPATSSFAEVPPDPSKHSAQAGADGAWTAANDGDRLSGQGSEQSQQGRKKRPS